MGFPVSISRIHTAYIGISDCSILGTNETFGEFTNPNPIDIHLGHLEGVPQPQLGDLRTMVINH